uniref:Uncharacterized protein n=1 Tax=Oryza punctata TaxID=4537 RepID=A0A0E0MBL2_ORYPU
MNIQNNKKLGGDKGIENYGRGTEGLCRSTAFKGVVSPSFQTTNMDKVLIAGFGRKGHAVGDIHGVAKVQFKEERAMPWEIFAVSDSRLPKFNSRRKSRGLRSSGIASLE